MKNESLLGLEVNSDFLGGLVPTVILLNYEGPILFVANDAASKPVLAYQVDEDGNNWRYFVVPADDALIDDLKNGSISILQAIQNEYSWIVDIDIREWTIRTCVEIPFAALPSDCRPKENSFLKKRSEVPNLLTRPERIGRASTVIPAT